MIGHAVYSLTPQFPAIIEDFNIGYHPPYSDLIKRIHKVSPLVKKIELMDKYGDQLTLRITYHSDSRQLSSSDIKPLRHKLNQLFPD